MCQLGGITSDNISVLVERFAIRPNQCRRSSTHFSFDVLILGNPFMGFGAGKDDLRLHGTKTRPIRDSVLFWRFKPILCRQWK
jgi:hypothetical protein